MERRIKAIRLADRSELGRSNVKEYLSDELSSDFNDEKEIFQVSRSLPIVGPEASFRTLVFQSSVLRNKIGLCCKLSSVYYFIIGFCTMLCVSLFYFPWLLICFVYFLVLVARG